MHTRVAVLRGGPSGEHEVSIRSGQNALESLDRALFLPIDIVITKSGEWLRNGRSRSPHEALYGVDVALVMLHGAYGEDGGVQRELERHGVPYVGSRPHASAMAFHKAIAKDHVRRAGMRVPRHMIVGSGNVRSFDTLAASIVKLLGPVSIVKPVADGSSLGVLKTNNEHELLIALRDSLKRYEQVLVEEYIAGREATVGVIERFRGQQLYALPTVEIIPEHGLFDYEAKYDGTTIERCPSTFSAHTKHEIERLAVVAHQALGLRHYSRSDFIVAHDGMYFLETNTLPGLTEQSLFPKALHAVGSSTKEFLSHVLTQALHRLPAHMA